MKAVVLVGGEGTRLRPLTYTTPKQMLPVVEVTMIERVVAHLAAHEVDHVVLSMCYRPDAFVAAFPDDRCAGVDLTYAVEPTALDTAGAIRFAARAADVDGTFLVVNGDVLTDLDVTALVSFHRQRRAHGTIALTMVDDPAGFGMVATNGDGRVQAFVEKPPAGESPVTHFVNAGTYVLEPEVIERIPDGRRVSIEREVFPALADPWALYAQGSPAYWIDAGTPPKYLQAHRDLLSGARPGPPAPGARERGDGVWTLGHPVVDAEVAGPSLVGDAAFVARGSRVGGSVVGAGARVEGGTVLDSVLLPGAVVRAGAVVEGSIVGAGAVVGEGAAVADLTVIGDRVELHREARLRGGRVPA